MKYVILIVAMLAIASCGTPEPVSVPPIVIQSEPIVRPVLNLPSVDRYSASPVNWSIITVENADQIFADMTARGDDPVLFGVTANGYEAIATNTQEALRIILQQQAVIDGYREWLTITDGRIRVHNQNVGQ